MGEGWGFGGFPFFDQDFNLFDPTSVQSSQFDNKIDLKYTTKIKKF